MKKIILSTTVAFAMCALPAFAADMPVKAPVLAPAPAASMFDIAFGALLASDYNFRGVSQSDRGPSVGAYFEPRFKLTPGIELYAGFAAYSVKLPTTPTAETNLYGGVRFTMGPVTLDLGGLYYYYPHETQVFLDPVTLGVGNPAIPGAIPWTKRDTDFGEAYGKLNYTMNDYVSLGAYVFYSPDLLNTGADGTYAGATAKFTAPSGFMPGDVGAYLSGEVAHYWLGTTDAFFGNVDLPDYTYWNVGIGFTYKAVTLDLRYHDTSLTQTECFAFTGDLNGLPGGKGALGRSTWCGEAFIAKLSFDTTLSAFR